jgi:hypothetical protein
MNSDISGAAWSELLAAKEQSFSFHVVTLIDPMNGPIVGSF